MRRPSPARGRPSVGARGRRFVLEVALESPDGFGGVIRTYQPGPQLWGAIALVGQTARDRAGRPESVATHRVTLGYRDGIRGGMRLALGPRRFDIKVATDPDGRRIDLVCLVEEIELEPGS